MLGTAGAGGGGGGETPRGLLPQLASLQQIAAGSKRGRLLHTSASYSKQRILCSVELNASRAAAHGIESIGNKISQVCFFKEKVHSTTLIYRRNLSFNPQPQNQVFITHELSKLSNLHPSTVFKGGFRQCGRHISCLCCHTLVGPTCH
jgi:hypothetical protein